MTFSMGDLVQLSGEQQYVKVGMVDDSGRGLVPLVLDSEPGRFRQVTLDSAQPAQVQGQRHRRLHQRGPTPVDGRTDPRWSGRTTAHRPEESP